MSDAPKTIWAKEGMPGYVTDGPVEGVYDVKYRRADLPAPDPMDNPRVQALVEAVKKIELSTDTREQGAIATAALMSFQSP